MEVWAEGIADLHSHYSNSAFMRTLNVTLEDQLWALDCVHSRSFAVPQAISKAHIPLLLCHRQISKAHTPAAAVSQANQ